MATGRLRVYLGAAPGVGKTFKMLDEGHRRLARGTDVVVGLVETHGRRHTTDRLDGLELVPRRDGDYRGARFTELDLAGLLARRPEVALIDELAHTNVPGSKHAKRWQDVQELLDAGIDVITTVNVQHLESLNDVVQEITGAAQQETVPDAVVRAAEQIELVDMAPEALRRRMAHGNIYAAEKIDSALGNYFRSGNLTALRELALIWLADRVDDELDRYRAEHHIGQTWEARERVVVALTGGSEGDTLIRRGTRIAARSKGADLLAVHVNRNDGLSGSTNGAAAGAVNLARQRILVESLGGTYHQVVGGDVPAALLDFARGVNATQLVLGASSRGRAARLFSPGVGGTTAAASGAIDVHLVTHEQVPGGRDRWFGPVGFSSGLGPARRIAGFLLAVIGLPLVTWAMVLVRDGVSLATDILAFLLVVIGVALVGGLYPAVPAAVFGFLLLNWYFTAPVGRFTVAQRENVLALSAFVLVAVAVSTVVDLAARRTREAARARTEAGTLFTLAGSVLRGDRPLPALLAQLKESFGLSAVTLLERRPDVAAGPGLQHQAGAWKVVESAGDRPCTTPAEGDTEVRVDDDISLVLRGRTLAAADRRVVEAFGAQAAVALRQERLAEQASTADALAEIDRLRTALLNAVSHDLRTPLASATAAVSSLRSADVAFTATDRAELLATAEESLDRLGRLVENLLDMSRLQAGALALSMQPTSLAEIVPMAVDELGDAGREIRIDVPDELAEVVADAALLDRALVNLLTNAVRFSPPGHPPTIAAGEHAGKVEIRVIDHGPGVAEADRDRVFLPFQRLGDRDNGTGVGLGLALSRGLVEAMGGSITPETTPGGGLTMTVRLPAAPAASLVPPEPVP